MDGYLKGPLIGEGTYGSVISATHKETGRQVAIKKVRLGTGKDGVQTCALREIKALKELQCPHVVQLLEVFPNKSSLSLVFEYMDFSLEDVIRDTAHVQLSPGDIKAYMQMLLQALHVVHSNSLIHRDVKPDNLLMAADGQLKLADFGLTREPAAPDGKMTHAVFGRWYRAPELLFASTSYGPEVDMWAAGCVFAELLLRRPWFQGSCDMDQLDRIFKVLGVPPSSVWPPSLELAHQMYLKPAPGQPLEAIFPQATPAALDLLAQLVSLDPSRRLTAAAALAHPYFSEAPVPTSKEALPRPSQRCRGMLQVVPGMLRHRSRSGAQGRPQLPGTDSAPPCCPHISTAGPAAAAAGQQEEDALQPFGSRAFERCLSAPEAAHFAVPGALAAAAAGAQHRGQAEHQHGVHWRQNQGVAAGSSSAGAGWCVDGSMQQLQGGAGDLHGMPAAGLVAAAAGTSHSGMAAAEDDMMSTGPAGQPQGGISSSSGGGTGRPKRRIADSDAAAFGSTRQQLFRSPVPATDVAGGGSEGWMGGCGSAGAGAGQQLPPRHNAGLASRSGGVGHVQRHHQQQAEQQQDLVNQENQWPCHQQHQHQHQHLPQQQAAGAMRPPVRPSRQLSDLTAALNAAAQQGGCGSTGLLAHMQGAHTKLDSSNDGSRWQQGAAAAGHGALDALMQVGAGQGSVSLTQPQQQQQQQQQQQARLGVHGMQGVPPVLPPGQALPPLLQQQYLHQQYALQQQQQQQQAEANGGQQQQQHLQHADGSAQLLGGAGGPGYLERQLSNCSSEGAGAAERHQRRVSDDACPMSLGTSALKRTRAVFERPLNERRESGGAAGVAAGDDMQPMSVSLTQRKVKRPSLSRVPSESLMGASVAGRQQQQTGQEHRTGEEEALAVGAYGPMDNSTAAAHLHQQQGAANASDIGGTTAPEPLQRVQAAFRAAAAAATAYGHEQQQQQQLQGGLMGLWPQPPAAAARAAGIAGGSGGCAPTSHVAAALDQEFLQQQVSAAVPAAGAGGGAAGGGAGSGGWVAGDMHPPAGHPPWCHPQQHHHHHQQQQQQHVVGEAPGSSSSQPMSVEPGGRGRFLAGPSVHPPAAGGECGPDSVGPVSTCRSMSVAPMSTGGLAYRAAAPGGGGSSYAHGAAEPGQAGHHHPHQQHQQHVLRSAAPPSSSMAPSTDRGGADGGYYDHGHGGSVPPSTGGGSGWGCGGCGSMSVDPLDLEALGGWQRPKLSSAELRYLRQRTLDLDQALFRASQQGPDESPLPGKGLDYGAEDEEEAAVAAAAGTQSQQLPASQEQQQQQRLEAAAAGAGGGREAGLQGVAGLLGPGVVAGGLWG